MHRLPAARDLLPILVLVVTGTLAVARPTTPPATVDQAGAAQARPNIVVIETDDQTVESMRVMDNVNSLIGGRGRPFGTTSSTIRSAAPRGPPSSPASTPTTTACSATRRRPAASTASRNLHGTNNLAVWLPGHGYYTAMIGKYLSFYASNPPVPPGWSEWRGRRPPQ